MENSAATDCENKNLIHELVHGRELAKQLQVHLNAPSSSHATREFLSHKILNSFNKALSMLTNRNNGSAGREPQLTAGGEPQLRGGTIGLGRSESPRSFSGSPRSEDSDLDFKDQDPQKDGSKKRKSSMAGWTQQVQICPGTGLEGPLDDGFSWRKYGQKDILGAKYPRGYYRCSHRNGQGCLATKQVQRSDENPTIFEITYRGRHTCSQCSNFTPPSSCNEHHEPPMPPTGYHHHHHHQNQLIDHQLQQNQPHAPELLLNFQSGLKVITEELDTHRDNSFPSFCFPLTSNAVLESNLSGNFSPNFVSPATSGSSYFPVSPTRVSSLGGNQNLHASDSELTEIISAATSATNSPTVGLGFPFGQLEFDSNFTFDNNGFFS